MPNPIEEVLREFDEKFISWVVLGSTLNDGSERRWRYTNQQPEEIISFLRLSLTQALTQQREEWKGKVEGMKKPSLTNPPREGIIGTMAINHEYNQALSDVLTILDEGEMK